MIPVPNALIIDYYPYPIKKINPVIILNEEVKKIEKRLIRNSTSFGISSN
jgi:hypothetical protein